MQRNRRRRRRFKGPLFEAKKKKKEVSHFWKPPFWLTDFLLCCLQQSDKKCDLLRRTAFCCLLSSRYYLSAELQIFFISSLRKKRETGEKIRYFNPGTEEGRRRKIGTTLSRSLCKEFVHPFQNLDMLTNIFSSSSPWLVTSILTESCTRIQRNFRLFFQQNTSLAWIKIC